GAEGRACCGERVAARGAAGEPAGAATACTPEVMSKRRSLSDDERALWDTVTRAIAPLRKRKKVKNSDEPALSSRPAPLRPAPAAKAAPVAPAQIHPAPSLAPLGRRMRSKLARGTEPIDDRIDLHGMTQADAHAALAHFLRRAQHRGARVVLV